MTDISASIPRLLEQLRADYPDATYELNWQTPAQMLVAAILAAQSSDQRVNQVTATLFQDYPDPQAFADADPEVLEEKLNSISFYRKKTRTLQTVCRILVDRFQGQVPPRMEDLTSLPGVARKTANVVLNCCFDLPSGIIVDTHVIRVSQRLGLTHHKQADRIESDLLQLIPQSEWTWFGPALIRHGRNICKAKSPHCQACPLLSICPRQGLKTPRADPNTQPTELPLFPPAASSSSPRSNASSDPSLPRPSSTPISETDPQPPIPAGLESWSPILASEIAKPYFPSLLQFVAQERESHPIFPPASEVFTAFALTPPDQVKVLILGQDPYHDDGQAHGLSFSVKRGVKPPPSLRNIFLELQSDLDIPAADHGDLSSWAKQGVMLLNTVLTVRAHQANSHRGQGWETFTDAVIKSLGKRQNPVIFVLWGGAARKKAKWIDPQRHTVLESAHPSPLSAHNGFFGSRPFSRINRALQQAGHDPIDWKLPD